MIEPQTDRREFLKLSGKIAALITAIRAGFVDRKVHARSSEGPPTPREKPLPEEVQKALASMAVIDIGAVEYGEVVPLTTEQTWQLLTGEKGVNESKISEMWADLAAVEPERRIPLFFLDYGKHGANVVTALQTGLVSLLKRKVTAKPHFVPVSEFANDQPLMRVTLGDRVVSPGRDGRGTQFTIEISQPKMEMLPKQKVISLSMQVGKLDAVGYDERGRINNMVLRMSDVISLINNYTYNETSLRVRPDQPSLQFLLPPGRGISDIASITVMPAEETDQAQTFAFNREKWGVQTAVGTTVVAEDSQAQQVGITLTLQDGTTVDGKTEIAADEYDYNYEAAPELLSSGPRGMKGAYHPENPNRAENLKAVKDLLRKHLDHFFVLALGNYGDVLTQEDMVDMPTNVLFVGQALRQEYDGKKFISGTYGNTSAEEHTIFIATKELKIEGDGSSLAVPIAALITSFLCRDTDQVPTRDEVLEQLKAAGCLMTADVPVDQSGDLKTITVLDIDKCSALLNPTQPALKLSRRDVLRGRVRGW